MGADILSIITPYFAAISQEELYEHYRAIAEAVDLPIIIYNIPARTGVNVAPDTIARLARIDNIVGAKDSSGNFDNMLQYIERTRGQDFHVLSGNDSLILWNLLAGGAGGIAGCANVYPETMVSIYERFVAGISKARARRRILSVLSGICLSMVTPTQCKGRGGPAWISGGELPQPFQQAFPQGH